MSTSSAERPRFGAGRRLCRDLAVVVSAAGLVIEGGSRQSVFRGRAATEVLPRLLPLLDGSRDSVGLAEQLGITAAQVNQVLDLLAEGGLVEAPAADLPTADPPADVDPAVLGWFSRNLPESGGRACAEEVLAALADTTVVVVAVPDIADKLRLDLTRAGIGRVVVVDSEAAAFCEPARQGSRTLGVTVAADKDAIADAASSQLAQARSRMEKWAAEANVPVLNVAWTQEFVDIGPVSVPGFSACPDCSRRSRFEEVASGIGEPDGTESASGPASASGNADLAAGLAAAELVALAARLPSAADPRTMTRISTTDFGSDSFWVTSYEGCDSCSGLAQRHTDDARDQLTDVFEWSVQELPRAVSPGRVIPPWEMERILALKRRRPTLPTLPRRPLPAAVLRAPGHFGLPVDDDSDAGTARATCLDVDLWATLLRQSAGFHAAPATVPAASPHRWAPSGGGLASVELFVIDEAGMAGLPGTVFRYDDLAHSLLAVRDDHIELARILAGTDLDAAGAMAVTVFVAAHSRLATKYREYAYRVDHLDAGVASTQFAAVARAHGLAPRFATRWDGRIAEVLGLARDDEFVTAVAALHPWTPHAEGTTCR